MSEKEREMEKYELVKDLGAGNFGVARLLRHKETKELVAMKYIERGHKVICLFVLLSVWFLRKLVFPEKVLCFVTWGILKMFANVHNIPSLLVLWFSCEIPRRKIEDFLGYCFWFLMLQIDENVAREIINHRSLRHPNIIRFKEASTRNRV